MVFILKVDIKVLQYHKCWVSHHIFFFVPVVRRVPPRFSIPPTNHEVMPGGSVNLTCVAVGAPMPYVKWMAGDVELTKDEEMPVGRNVLELNNIRQSTNYTCVAISSLGMIEATAQVSVKGKILKWPLYPFVSYTKIVILLKEFFFCSNSLGMLHFPLSAPSCILLSVQAIKSTLHSCKPVHQRTMLMTKMTALDKERVLIT